MQEKYGFVYIWLDRKHKRFYIGAHWGTKDDGYICSSSWMKQAYKNRPEDFRRRILKVITTNKKDLFEEEQKFLDKIKDNELKNRYYNLSKLARCPPGSPDKKSKEKAKETWKQKMATGYVSPNKGKNNLTSWNKGIPCSEKTKEKLREANKKQFENEEQKKLRSLKTRELWNDPEYRANQIAKRKGKTPWNKGLVIKNSNMNERNI